MNPACLHEPSRCSTVLICTRIYVFSVIGFCMRSEAQPVFKISISVSFSGNGNFPQHNSCFPQLKMFSANSRKMSKPSVWWRNGENKKLLNRVFESINQDVNTAVCEATSAPSPAVIRLPHLAPVSLSLPPWLAARIRRLTCSSMIFPRRHQFSHFQNKVA